MAYLDCNSTTPPDLRVLRVMHTVQDVFGNPSSNHGTGLAARELVSKARDKVASAIDMKEQDVIFTSGATEANNLATFGLRRGMGRPIRVLACSTEHKSVLEACRALKADDSSVELIPVNKDGTVNMGRLEAMLEDNADLVSIGVANSETGVINDVHSVAKIAHDGNALVHCDATQAIGRIPFNAMDSEIDMVTFSAHKMYGPKGCGALVAGRDARRKLLCMIHGGGQERNMRSGTLNVPAIAGFGAACDLIPEGIADSEREERLRDRFESDLVRAIHGVSINGKGARRLPNTSNIRIEGVPSDALVSRLHSIEIATGSACSSDSPMPSHVLLAMGLNDIAAYESFRVSLGRETTWVDMESAVSEITETASAIRQAMEVA